MLASHVRFGCAPATSSDGSPVVIAWMIGADGRLLWLRVVES